MKKRYTQPSVSVVVGEPPTLLAGSGPQKTTFKLQIFDHEDDVDRELKLWEESVTIYEKNPDDID